MPPLPPRRRALPAGPRVFARSLLSLVCGCSGPFRCRARRVEQLMGRRAVLAKRRNPRVQHRPLQLLITVPQLELLQLAANLGDALLGRSGGRVREHEHEFAIREAAGPVTLLPLVAGLTGTPAPPAT